MEQSTEFNLTGHTMYLYRENYNPNGIIFTNFMS